MTRRVLLDEMVPIKLRHNLKGEVSTVEFLGWKGTRNGSLLALTAQQFDVLLTFDLGLEHEQNVAKHGVGVVLIRSEKKGLRFLIAHQETIQTALDKVALGEVLVVTLEDV